MCAVPAIPPSGTSYAPSPEPSEIGVAPRSDMRFRTNGVQSMTAPRAFLAATVCSALAATGLLATAASPATAIDPPEGTNTVTYRVAGEHHLAMPGDVSAADVVLLGGSG